MRTVKKSIILTKEQDTYIKSLINKGFYINESEYIRDVVRKDQQKTRDMLDLQDKLIDGMGTGSSDTTIDTIWDKVVEEYEQR